MEKMAKAKNQRLVHTNSGSGTPICWVYANCSECGELVTRSQYGFDDECPNCKSLIDWSEEE